MPKLNCAASTKRNRSRCLHCDRSIWDRNSSKTGPDVLEVQLSDGPDRERINGTVSRSRVNKRPICRDFMIGTIWNRFRVDIALKKGPFTQQRKIERFEQKVERHG